MEEFDFSDKTIAASSVGHSHSYDDFFVALGRRESSLNYDAVNSLGYLGKYQFGKLALKDIGYYSAGHWTGRNGINSKSEFLANHGVQEQAIRADMQLQWLYLTHKGVTHFVGHTIKGIHVTVSGMLAGAHLVGAGAEARFLRSAGAFLPHDANGVPVTTYMKLFAGYETPFSVPHSHDVFRYESGTHKAGNGFLVDDPKVNHVGGADQVAALGLNAHSTSIDFLVVA
jgi:hypothetical protein